MTAQGYRHAPTPRSSQPTTRSGPVTAPRDAYQEGTRFGGSPTWTGAALQRVVDAAEAHGDLGIHEGHREWRMRCPHHMGRTNTSVSLTQGDRGAVMHCHNGCSTADVVAELNLTLPALFDDYVERPRSGRYRPRPRLRLRTRVTPGDPPPTEAEWAAAFQRVARKVTEWDTTGRYSDDD